MSMVSSKEQSKDVCIVCALAEEAKAVLDVVSQYCNVTFVSRTSHRYGYDYRTTTIQNNQGEPLALHVSWLPRVGSQETILHLTHVLEEYHPRFAAMTGICAGDRLRVSLGDLVVADRLYTYDSGKYVTDERGRSVYDHDVMTYQLDDNILRFVSLFDQWKPLVKQLSRPPSKRQQREWLLNQLLYEQIPSVQQIPQLQLQNHVPDWRRIVYELQQGSDPLLTPTLALREGSRIEQLQYGKDPFPYTDPQEARCHIKPMASGSAVRSDNPFKDIQIPVRGTVAVEMEGAAFGRVMASVPLLRWLVVKGVSDYADSDKDDSYHEYASASSALYLLCFLQEYVTDERIPRASTPSHAAKVLEDMGKTGTFEIEQISNTNVINSPASIEFADLSVEYSPSPPPILTPLTPELQRTYAIVIGIEKYRLGDELDGPAHYGRRFADWLTAQGVPRNNIALLLSPLDRNLTFRDTWPGQYRWAATRERVIYATNQWLHQRSGDLLYLFWGGQGVMSSTGNWSLFYADSMKPDWHYLDLESLLVYLQSDYLLGFQKQICFIDAYANHQPEYLQESLGSGEISYSGSPLRNRQQFLFMASQEGVMPTNPTKEQNGLFPKILLEELTSGPYPRWAPDMEQLAQRIDKRFVELRENHVANQKPVQFRIRRWGKDETSVALNNARSKKFIVYADNQIHRSHFGEQLRGWRLIAHKARKPFARLVGVNDTIIRGWENGEIVPTVPYLRKIIEVHLSLGTLQEGREREEIERLWESARLTNAGLDVPIDEEWLKDILARQSIVRKILEKGSSTYTDEIQQNIAGLTAPVVDVMIRQRIRNFLDVYLGRTTHPVPFGGRDPELKFLDIWLNDPQQPPYLLLTAPAGRGKSALLVRWSQQVVTRSDIALLFVPVSIRFNTNLASVVFSTIVTSLAALHKEKVPNAHNMTTEVWQSLLANYLTRPLADGRRLILILDGIDEAADWEIGSALFPSTLALGTRIILSARTQADRDNAQAWLHIIGWDRPELASTLDLSPLTPYGVADVLARMGIPPGQLDTELSLSNELHRLSEGIHCWYASM